jgi:hypothetical protein
MRKIHLAILSISVSNCLLGQIDSAMLRRLNKAIYSCEVVSTNSQQLIVSFSTYQRDSILRVTNAWEHVCQNNEPISRVRILAAIQSDLANDTLLAKYLFHYRNKYINRVQESYVSANFELHKEYLDYVPPMKDFDQWTAHWASDLVRQHPANSSSYLVCLLLSNHIKEFIDTYESKAYRKHPLVVMVRDMMIAQSGERHFAAIKAGAWIPTGKLAQYQPCVAIGFELGGKVLERSRLDLVFDIAFLNGNSPITLQIGSAAPVQTDAKTVLDLGVAYTREFQLKRNLYLDAIAGLGYGRVDTELKKPKKPDQNDSYYGVATMDISSGVMLRTSVGGRHQLGLRFMYHYAPYKAFSDILVYDIGNQYSTIGLMFRL